MRKDFATKEPGRGEIRKHEQERNFGVMLTIWEGPFAYGYTFAGPDGVIGCMGACDSLAQAMSAADSMDWVP